jgi:hypothetical protein
MTSLLALVFILCANCLPQGATLLRDGSSPQLAVDARSTIRAIFGRGDTIFSATSRDARL